MRDKGSHLMRESWAPLGLLALALILAAKALLSGGELVLSSPHEDMALQFLPWRAFGFGELKAGNLALWNPHIFAGIPNLANFETALLYPPNWLHLILPVGQAVNLTIVLHLFGAGLFTYLWCRHSGFSRMAGALAGAMFMLSGPYYLRIYAGHLPPLCVMAWIPAVFWALDGWIATRDTRWCLFGMAAVAMQILGGNPQYLYYTCIASALYLGFNLRGSRGKTVLAGGWAAIYVGAAALAAIQLLPGLDMVGESSRVGGLSILRAGSFSLPPENIITFISPDFFGNLSGFPYFGRTHLWDACLFVGVSGLLLALLGAFHMPGKRGKIAALMVAATLLLALGRHVKPLYHLLYHILPGYGSVRGTLKFSILAVLFLSWLGAAGFDLLLKGTVKPKGLALSALSVALVTVVLGVWARLAGMEGTSGWVWTGLLAALGDSGENFLAPAGLIGHPSFLTESIRFSSGALLGTAGIIALSTLLLWLGSRSRRFAYAMWGLAFVELFLFAQGSTAVMRAEPPYEASWARRLENNPGDYRVLHHKTKLPNIAMSRGLRDISGYCQLTLERYVHFLAGTQGLDPEKLFAFPRITRVTDIFEILRLRYIFIGGPEPTVKELPVPMSRLQLMRDWKLVVDGDEALRVMLAPGFDPRRTVLLEAAPDPVPEEGGDAAGEVSFLEVSTDELEITAELGRPAILLVTDSYSKGWRVRPLEAGPQSHYQVLPADLALMAVPLAAGRHHFVLEYAPPAFRFGAIVSAAALAAFLTVLFYPAFARSRRRKRV